MPALGRAQPRAVVGRHPSAAIKRFDGKPEVFPMPEPVGSIAFRAKGGLLAAMQSGIYVWESGCDRAGRFWVGTMKDPEHTPTGSLYCLKERFELKRSGIKVPNSLAWSPDGRTMYFADSPRHKIWTYDYDADTGAMRNERLFAAPHPGFPDGSCVDAEGCLWNAEYGGAQLGMLYITTAQGGGVYAFNCPVTGLAEARFAG
jgi:sugar lactone lactonase YvrE